MKKNLSSLFSLLVLFVSFGIIATSCSGSSGGDDPQPPTPQPSTTLSVTPLTPSLLSGANCTTTISVVTNNSTDAWSITDIPEWLHFSSTSGIGTTQITITTKSENFSDEAKEANVNVSIKGANASFTVKQEPVFSKELRVGFSDLLVMSDGFAANLSFPASAKGYREKTYTAEELKMKTDRDIYNELMKTTEYEGSITKASCMKYNAGTDIVYCVAAYGNENNADGTHKYGPITIKRMTTLNQTYSCDMYAALTYNTSTWTVTTQRSGNYGQQCEDYYAFAANGDIADELFVCKSLLSDAYLSLFVFKPIIDKNYDTCHKSGPQSIKYSRTSDNKFFFTSWGTNKTTKQYSSELGYSIYRDLSSSAKGLSKGKQMDYQELRQYMTPERLEKIRQNTIVYKIQ